LQRAYSEAPQLSQSDIARELGVHRSVITRQLRGYQDMGLARVAELSWALGYEPTFELLPRITANGSDATEGAPSVFATTTATTAFKSKIQPSDLELVQ